MPELRNVVVPALPDVSFLLGTRAMEGSSTFKVFRAQKSPVTCGDRSRTLQLLDLLLLVGYLLGFSKACRVKLAGLVRSERLQPPILCLPDRITYPVLATANPSARKVAFSATSSSKGLRRGKFPKTPFSRTAARRLVTRGLNECIALLATVENAERIGFESRLTKLYLLISCVAASQSG